MRLRSLLFVPGSRPDQMQKALGTQADALILDLEDSVAYQGKSTARQFVSEFLERRPRSVPIFVRINPLNSGHSEEDLRALANKPPDGLVLPKANGASSVVELSRRLHSLNLPAIPVIPIAAEKPGDVFLLAEYSTVANHLLGLTWGAEDLATSIGASSPRNSGGRFTAPIEMVRGLTLFAAHAAGVPAIETVYPAFTDLAGLTAQANLAARDGFTGMLAIHPSQVPPINSAFTPSDEAVRSASRIVAAFRYNPDAGALNVDGEMVDRPHLLRAQRILSNANPSDTFLPSSGKST